MQWTGLAAALAACLGYLEDNRPRNADEGRTQPVLAGLRSSPPSAAAATAAPPLPSDE